MTQNKRALKQRGQHNPKFRAELLGQPIFFSVDEAGRETVIKLRSRQSVALLAYLHLRGRSVSREQIIDLLWHEEKGKTARASLRVLLAKLKKLLPNVLVVSTRSVALMPGGLAWDTERFETLLSRGAAASLTEAALLYQGEFMLDFELRGSGEFEAWLETERESWRERYNVLMRKLVDLFLAQGRGVKALPYIERWGKLEPDSEAAYRQHMWLSWKRGDADPAITHYRKLVRKLDHELGVAPEESTKELYKLILHSLNQGNALQKSADVPPTVPGLNGSLEVSGPDANIGLNAEPRSLDTDPRTLYHSNLELTSFIGRQKELAELISAIRQHRLVTVHGVGGGGKTRLTLEASRVLRQHFGNGIFVFTCEQLDVHALAERLDSLVKNLQTVRTPLLFVLDSFDLVGSPHSHILNLIHTVPCASVVVTGREPLGILGEYRLNLSPLPYPTNTGASEHLANDPSVQLFWNRAFLRDIQSPENEWAESSYMKGLHTENLHYAARIAHAVGGLPLGLEIAASQLGQMTLAELTRLAEKTPHSLLAEHKTVVRHESLAKLIVDAWGRLSREQKQRLARLTDCSEPFHRRAVSKGTHLGVQDLQAFAHMGFLIRYSHDYYGFPLPFRHFVNEMSGAALEISVSGYMSAI